jgi:hypothetical protein
MTALMLLPVLAVCVAEKTPYLVTASGTGRFFDGS